MDSILVNISNSIDNIIKILNYYETTIKLRPKIMEVIDYNRDRSVISQVTDYVNYKDLNSEILYSSLYVMVHATFEEYVREIINKYIETLKISRLSEEQLERIIMRNKQLSGSLLKNIYNPKDYQQLDFDSIIRNLVTTCDKDNKEMKLNPEAFSFQSVSINIENFEKIFTSFGVNFNWDTFVDSGLKLKEYFNIDKPRPLNKEVTKFLGKMVKTRNKFAHRGEIESEVVSFSDVMEQLNFIKAFLHTMIKYIESQVVK